MLRSDDPLYTSASERMAIQAIAVAADGTVTIAMNGGGVFRGSSQPGALLQSSDRGLHWRKLRDLPSGRVLSLDTGHQLSGFVINNRAPFSMHSCAFDNFSNVAVPSPTTT